MATKVTADLAPADAKAGPPSLRSIRGPSALGRDAPQFWRLLWYIAKTEFRLKYQGSVFGYVWSLVSPLLLFGVLYLVFTRVVRFGNDVPNYPAVLLLNIMLFQFFAESSSRCVFSIVQREDVVRKMEFPRLVIPLSIILAATFSLGLDMVVVVGFILATGVPVTTGWLFFPVMIIWIEAFTIGVSLLLSTLFVRFRDVAQIWTVVTRVMFYGSPVLFPITLFPAGWKALLLLNPLAPLFTQSRVWIVDPSAPTFSEALGGAIYWLYPMLVMFAIILLGVWMFERETPRVAEEL
jgi:ABC-2 type transport system permease protein